MSTSSSRSNRWIVGLAVGAWPTKDEVRKSQRTCLALSQKKGSVQHSPVGQAVDIISMTDVDCHFGCVNKAREDTAAPCMCVYIAARYITHTPKVDKGCA